MTIKIRKRILKNSEIAILSEETKKARHLGYIKPKTWQRFSEVYAAENNKALVGICTITRLNDWIKIGPVLVLQKSRGEKIGSRLIKNVIKDNLNTNLFVGSSNLLIHKIVKKEGFLQTNFFKLPFQIKKYFFTSLFTTYGIRYLLDSAIKKSKYGFKPYSLFIRMKNI